MKKSIAMFVFLWAMTVGSTAQRAYTPNDISGDSARLIKALVGEAANLIRQSGESAFDAFRLAGSRWRTGETYIFVLDPAGLMIDHPDPELQGKNQLELRDVNGKPIIKGLIGAVSDVPDKTTGWYHYQWPVPGGLIPRWKSSYVQRVDSPSGKSYIVGCGTYNDRMERDFVVDIVNHAAGRISAMGTAAYPLFHDPSGPFLAKDAYVFVVDPQGTDVVNPAFRNLEGRNLLDMKDANGKFFVQEMLRVVNEKGSGWIDYMWPKPGESIPTQKSAYVTKAMLDGQWVMAGCGVYLADAPKSKNGVKKVTAAQLTSLVREASSLLEKKGADAYAEFRTPGSKWLHDETYIFVWSMKGIRVFHGADPKIEGADVHDLKDNLDRPFGRMFLETASSATGEGWVHYMYPEPGNIFPTWKSTFVKRVNYPSGEPYLVGCGIYNMQMDRAFIEDVVNRAAVLVEQQGAAAFTQLRDKTGPFYFMDMYVFVDDEQGVELVNPAYPSLEGKNLMEERDLKGKLVVRDYIDAARRQGHAWIDYYWYRPGRNDQAVKHTYVREVRFGKDKYVVGAGFFDPE